MDKPPKQTRKKTNKQQSYVAFGYGLIRQGSTCTEHVAETNIRKFVETISFTRHRSNDGSRFSFQDILRTQRHRGLCHVGCDELSERYLMENR